MKTEFDDALRGIYSDHDEVQPEQSADFREITLYSVLTFIGGILSAITFMHWALAVLPITAITCGILALKRILNNPEETGGFVLTTTGLALAAIFWCGGYVWLAWSYFNSIPAGYVAVDFLDLTANPKTGTLPVPILKLAEEGQKIVLTGYMYPGRRLAGIDNFALVRTTEHCKFCSPRTNPTDMVNIEMTEGRTVNYRTRSVRIGGVLKIDPNYQVEEKSPYVIEADYFR